MLALLKEKLVNVKYQQKTCDLGSINRTEKFQERGVIIIDDDSESESSYKFDHEEPDAGIMLIRSDSESPTIDLAEVGLMYPCFCAFHLFTIVTISLLTMTTILTLNLVLNKGR